MRMLVAAAILLLGAPAAIAQAAGYPTAQCSLSDDKSKLLLTVSNSGTGAFACSAQCKYTEAGRRALQTFNCTYTLSGGTTNKLACALDGSGPGHFATVQPTRFVCQPR
ncbi:MAG TPA: hypothetical protein VGN80_15845 [Devosiaceae bacterium]|nr:hypothetical protein [Devosiaceae bacterium]